MDLSLEVLCKNEKMTDLGDLQILIYLKIIYLMKNLVFKKDINYFFNIIRKDKYNKILIISGKNSFFKSGANEKFKKCFVNKK